MPGRVFTHICDAPINPQSMRSAGLVFGLYSVYAWSMPNGKTQPKLTPSEVDGWLAQLRRQIRSIVSGPAGEMKARLSLIERKIERWRERLRIEKKPP